MPSSTSTPGSPPPSKPGLARFVRNAAVLALVAGFCVPALGFAASLVLGERDGVSESENRRLASLPALDGDIRDYTSAMDDYLEDSFGFRMILIRLARKLRDNLGENPPDVVQGKEGWLFLGNLRYRDEFEGHGRWDNSQVNAWVGSFSEIKTALNARGISFAAFIAVDKARAFPEFLPDDWSEGDRRFRSALYAASRPDATGLIDAEAYVLAAKAQGEKVFFQRDTHWTLDGTYDLALAIMDQLDPERTLPRHQPGPKTLQGHASIPDLDRMSGLETSQEPQAPMMPIPRTGPGGTQYIAPETEDSPYRDRLSSLLIEGQNAASNVRLVIVGDSFGDSMVGHFLPSVAEIVRIHHGATMFDVPLDDILAYEPDMVLFATAERQAAEKAQPFAPLIP